MESPCSARPAWIDALDEFRETIRLQPDHAAAHSEVGAILCDFKQDYDAAIAEFREAIRLKPDDPIAHYGLGNVFSHRGNPEDALVEYREVLRLKPGNAEVHEAIGRTLARQRSTRSGEFLRHNTTIVPVIVSDF